LLLDGIRGGNRLLFLSDVADSVGACTDEDCENVGNKLDDDDMDLGEADDDESVLLIGAVFEEMVYDFCRINVFVLGGISRKSYGTRKTLTVVFDGFLMRICS
jgi:hypothetical protein